jgi:hypothetical protein
MKRRYCLLGFHNFGNTKLDTFSGQVRNGIYNNAVVFALPPVIEADYASAQESFETAAAEYKLFGITKKTVYLAAKKTLLEKLDALAVYVDGKANGDGSMIALSGFIPSQDQFVRVQDLDKIQGFNLKRTEAPGGVAVEIAAITKKGSISYCCVASDGRLTNPALINGQIVLTPGDTMVYQDYNKSRRKVFQGLTPGKEYFFYVFANNSASVSPLSDAKSLLVY